MPFDRPVRRSTGPLPSSSIVEVISPEAIAQARYALFEKVIKADEALCHARKVFSEDSANVAFWRGEFKRVRAALEEFGGRP